MYLLDSCFLVSKALTNMTPKQISKEVQRIQSRILAHRSYLHRYPELSFQEHNTMLFVADTLKKMGIKYEKGVGGTGVVGYIEAPKVSRWIGLRADLDALPIHEENDVEYKSLVPGVMHACGHDVHTSILLGAAEILQKHKDKLPCSVKLIFQPGEEMSPGGANYMIEAGVLSNPELEYLVALHVYPEMHVNNLGVRSGLYMASSDEIHLQFEGVGGHGALPENCVNPLSMAAEVILNAQNIIDKFHPEGVPTVLSFGRIEGLGSTNVIPSECTLKGTLRTMDEAWRKEFFDRFTAFTQEVASRYGGKVHFNRVSGYPFLKNDPHVTSIVKEALVGQFGSEHIEALPLRMTAEDFAFYSHKVPVSFFRLGVGDPAKAINYGVHHPKFDIHPGALAVGVEAMLAIVFNS
jgi:amidohydrolase